MSTASLFLDFDEYYDRFLSSTGHVPDETMR